MKNRFRFSFPSVFLVLLFCPSLTIYSQNGSLSVYPKSTSAYPVFQEDFDPATATQNDTLNGLLVSYGVIDYYKAFPGATYQSLQNVYFIILTGASSLLKAELDNTGLFDSTKTLPNIITNDCENPFTPDDPDVSNWANEVIEVECAWDIEQGDPAIVAGIVDTRFDMDHPDLENKLVAVWGNNNPANDPHGITMAGAIGAEPNNNYCIAGVGYNTMLAGYCHANNGATAWTAVWTAFLEGRPVINCSWSTLAGFWEPHIDAVNQMVEDGTTLCVSAGVPGGDNAHNIIAPIHGVIKVSLIDEDENFPLQIPNGPQWMARDPDVDISAPGANGVEALRGEEEGFCSPNSEGGGTSIATAHVSGTVALLISANSCLTPPEIEGIIKATAKPVLNGDEPSDQFYGRVGAGYINVYNAVRMAKADPDPITGNATWDYPVYVDGSQVIEEGGSLTISSQVRFGPNGKIVVKRGGELYVDGGHLTNGCGDRWEGIIVEGNKNTHQAIGLVSGKRDQGYVELTNAVIENAIYGIRLYDPDAANPGSTSGGVVIADGAQFINNIVGVDFAPYQNFSELYGNKMGNLSAFYSCSFLVDVAFPGDFADFRAHVNLKRVTGIEFYGCTFKNGVEHEEYNYADDAKFGLISRDADFLVTRRCGGPPSCSNPIPSRFEGFATAITAYNYSTLNTFRVTYTDFVDNYTGISASKIDNPYIAKNTFSVGMDLPGLNNPYTGIQLFRCTGFKVEENEFQPSSSALSGEGTIGIVTISSGDQPNEIYLNTSTGMDFGNLSNGDNRALSENEGLVFYCNINDENQYDFAVPDESIQDWGIAEHQGSLIKSAGNTFTSDPPNEETHFLNHAASIVYYHSQGEAPEDYTENKITLNGNADLNDCESKLPDDDQTAELAAAEVQVFEGNFFTGNENSEKFYAANMLIRNFLINDSIQEMDSVRTWLVNKGDLFSYFSIVDSWLQEEEPDSATQVLNAIPNQFNLSGEYLSEYNYFDSLKTIQISAQQAGKEDDEMVTDNLSAIQEIAEAGNYLASVQAQAMANSVLGPTYEQVIVLPEEFQPRMSLSEKKNEMTGKDKKAEVNSLLVATPNPANEATTIVYKLPEGELVGKLVLSAFDGRVLTEKEVGNNFGETLFNTASLPNGLYFCTLMSGDKKWKTIKLVIAR